MKRKSGDMGRGAAAWRRADFESFRRRWAGKAIAAEDVGPYIASARRHVLFVVALGAFSAQLAWQESERREAADLYGYVESVLAVASSIGEHRWSPAPQQFGHKVADALVGEGWQVKLKQMAGPERELLEMAGGTGVRLGTAVDPGNACRPAVAALGRDEEEAVEGVALAVRRVSIWGEAPHLTAAFADVFLVRAGSPCRRASASWQPFAVARYNETGLAVVLDERLHRRLGLWWLGYTPPIDDQKASEGDERRSGWLAHASAAQLDRLAGSEPYLMAVDAAHLKERVVRTAWAATHRSFELEQWREAIRAMVDDGLGPMGFWGFRLERSTATRAAPVVLLGLCLSFLYRVRRIDSAELASGEPWVVLMPRGLVEVVGAGMWAAATFAAVAGVAWATWVYEWSGRGVPGPYPWQDGPGAWAIGAPALEVVAVGLLVWAWCRVWATARRRWRLDVSEAVGRPSRQ